MVLVHQSIYFQPYLLYDASVNEKTKKLREMFDMDEKTGYPRHYNWRVMALLGQKYNYEDPYLKFKPYEPKNDISAKVTMAALTTISLTVFYAYGSERIRRPFWTKIPHIIVGSVVGSALMFYALDKTRERQGKRNAMELDYIRSHPERFEPIYRPKLREVLYMYVPVR